MAICLFVLKHVMDLAETLWNILVLFVEEICKFFA